MVILTGSSSRMQDVISYHLSPMTLSNELIRDYDELAASLGTTPKYNSHGQIIPIGRPEGKSSWIYSVYIGRALGFYNNW